MSKCSVHKIRCPYCSKMASQSIIESLDAMEDSDAFKLVNSGDVFKLVCPHCNSQFFFDHPVVYHDREKNFMIQYATKYEHFVQFVESAEAAKAKNKTDKKMYRNVNGAHDYFIEKVGIFTYGMNDIVAEMYKDAFFCVQKLENVDDIIYMFNSDCSDCRVRIIYFGDKEDDYFMINEELMETVKKDIAKMGRLEKYNDYKVNRDLILSILKNPKVAPLHLKLLKEIHAKWDDRDHDDGLAYARKSEYKEAITKLLPLAKKGHVASQNDLGVIYERLEDYASASIWYKESNTDVSIKNLLQLYDNKKLDYTTKEYLDLCNALIKNKNQFGYLYASYLYRDGVKCKKDDAKAFRTLLKGLIRCNENYRLVFELGYLLSQGIGCKQDHVKSHACYSAVLHHNDTIINKYAHYNFALQCYRGEGCDVDVPKAIKHFEFAAKNNCTEAIHYLTEIYGSEEYKDEEKLKYYMNMQ